MAWPGADSINYQPRESAFKVKSLEVFDIKTNNCVIVKQLWASIEERAWNELHALLHPEFICIFPQSGEKFTRDTYIKLNKEYPGEWHLRLNNSLLSGDWVITEVCVSAGGKIDTAVSFFLVQSGLVVELREYWPEPFQIPEWRRGWHG